jgi:hypothetical protein
MLVLLLTMKIHPKWLWWMSENGLWKTVYWFQLFTYLFVGGFFVMSWIQQGWSNLLIARWGGWHLATSMQYLIITAYCRVNLKRNFWGFINSLSVPLLAGVIGESFFSYLFFIPYYRPFAIPEFQATWWYGTWEFATLAFLAYASGAYKYIRWRRILYGLIALIPVMIAWITIGEFKVSACVCSYRLAYWLAPIPNLFEVIYYTVLFLAFLWALKFDEVWNRNPRP